MHIHRRVGQSIQPKLALVELLEVVVTYSDPAREMTGAGEIDGLALEVASKASRIGRKYEITGTIDQLELRIEVDGFSWRSDTEAAGVWGDRAVQLELAFANDHLLITGMVGEDLIDLTVVRRLGVRFTCMSDRDGRRVDLLLDGDEPRLRLTGEVERLADALTLVALSPPIARTRPPTSFGSAGSSTSNTGIPGWRA